MIVQTRQQRSRARRRLGRGTAAETARQAPSEPAAIPVPDARERAAGGPEDRARYQCACGCVFEAAVSTSVGCPRCGGTQAW